jgi:IclR family transcriptional regulator, KDG regulon repressor
MPARNYIAVVERTFRVVEAFNGQAQVSLADLASRTRMVKSSVYRILYTLTELGYVDKSLEGRYSLSTRWGRMAGGPHPPSNLITLASPLMTRLLNRFHETVNLGVLDGGEVLYIHVLESPHAFRLAAHAGMRSPVHSTALGKCLLSRRPASEVNSMLKQRPMPALTPRTICDRTAFIRELVRVRSQGVAVDNGEDSAGARCVAAPILNEAGEVIAAISISGPAGRIRPSRDRELAKALVEACRQISTTLSYTSVSRPSRELRGR